jgi:streptogrisin C
VRIRPSLTTLLVGAVLAISPTSAAKAALPGSDQPEFAGMVAAYQRDYPGISRAAAEAAVAGQGARVQLIERLAQRDPRTFGGAWFNPRTGVQHVMALTPATSAAALDLGRALGSKVVTHAATRNFAELMELRATIGAGADPVIGVDGVRRARVDVVNNRVEVAVAPAVLSAVRAKVGGNDGIAVVGGPATVPPEFPDACVSRYSCGAPLRSGIALWYDNVSHAGACSLGFTARATDGSRWAITAGHCALNTGTTNHVWGHGEQAIGPIRYPVNGDRYDIARILVGGPYWTVGGYLYNPRSPNTVLNVNYAITSRSTIELGDAVCLSAVHSVVGTSCGTITDTANAGRGMPEVSFDGCRGDSGGGWYALLGSERWAYGIHSGSQNSGCHVAGSRSFFTAVPDANAWWDREALATIRIEYRR